MVGQNAEAAILKTQAEEGQNVPEEISSCQVLTYKRNFSVDCRFTYIILFCVKEMLFTVFCEWYGGTGRHKRGTERLLAPTSDLNAHD